MTTATAVLELARQEIGYTEGRNNYSKYGLWYGLNHEPWCAMFVSWVFYESGLALPASTKKGFAYTPSGAAWFRRQDRWVHGGTANPRNCPPGSVVFYYWSSMGRIAHVGIVERWTSDTTFYAIEGNTNGDGSRDGGAVERRHRSVSTVTSKGGFGLPQFEKSTETQRQEEKVGAYQAGTVSSENKELTVPLPPPEGTGLIKFGQVWVSLGVDHEDAVVRLAIGKPGRWDITDNLKVPVGRKTAFRAKAGDEIASIEYKSGKHPVSVLVEYESG